MNPPPDELLDAVSLATRAALAGGEARGEHERALAVGVCAPGTRDPATGRITACLNMPGLVGFDLAGSVGTRLASLGLPVRDVHLTSDAYAAGIDAWCGLPEPKPARLLALSLGSGVGACVLDGRDEPGALPGRLVIVSGTSSGHLGQIDVGFDEPGRARPVGSDGGEGSLEAYIGLAALRARYGEDVANMLPCWSVGDAPVVALTRTLRIAHALYRPDAVVLLGGIGIRLGHLVRPLRAAVARGLTSLARPGWTLGCGRDDHHAARGAALLAQRAHERNAN